MCAQSVAKKIVAHFHEDYDCVTRVRCLKYKINMYVSMVIYLFVYKLYILYMSIQRWLCFIIVF